jgi:hypothetical protein
LSRNERDGAGWKGTEREGEGWLGHRGVVFLTDVLELLGIEAEARGHNAFQPPQPLFKQRHTSLELLALAPHLGLHAAVNVRERSPGDGVSSFGSPPLLAVSVPDALLSVPLLSSPSLLRSRAPPLVCNGGRTSPCIHARACTHVFSTTHEKSVAAREERVLMADRGMGLHGSASVAPCKQLASATTASAKRSSHSCHRLIV